MTTLIFLRIFFIIGFVYYIFSCIGEATIVFWDKGTDKAVEEVNKNGGIRQYVKNVAMSDLMRHIFYVFILGMLVFASWSSKSGDINGNNKDTMTTISIEKKLK